MTDFDVDRRRRRAAVLVIVAALVIAVALLLLAQAHFAALAQLMDRDMEAGTNALIKTIRWFIVFLVVPMAALLVYLGQLGLRAIRSARFPPPGTWMLHDRAVITGRPAVVRGWVLALIALVIALAVAQLAIHLWTLADELARSRDRVEPPASAEMRRQVRSFGPWLDGTFERPAMATRVSLELLDPLRRRRMRGEVCQVAAPRVVVS